MFAAHNEEGEYKAEIHEGYIGSSKLIPNSRFKMGKFFLGVGRLNQFHQHDWPFTSTPLVHQKFFGDEGVADTGLEYSYLLPTDSYWDITMGVTSNYSWGEGPQAKPRTPTYYIHPVNYVDFGETGGLQWGGTYLGRTDSVGLHTQLGGLDFVFKKQEGKLLDFLFQSEFWFQNQDGPNVLRDNSLGAYFYGQKAINENWYAGLRLDIFSDLDKYATDTGEKQKNLEYDFVPNITYKSSEFALVRFEYILDTQTNQGDSNKVNQTISIQLVGILGAHPAHAF
jgi:hypothetical protein